MSYHIAIVEDEPALAANYRDALERQRYRVTHYPDRAAAMLGLAGVLPDLVIIDIELGAEADGGFELCRALRSDSPTLPIIFLTARDSEIDAVSGLRLGADDYLRKDVSLPEMQARIAALLRRAEAMAAPEQTEHLIECDALVLNTERITASWQGTAVRFTGVEHAMLTCLARWPGHVKSRQQLLDAADVVQDERTVDSHVKRMRGKFRQVDPHFDQIESVHAKGYRWRGD